MTATPAQLERLLDELTRTLAPRVLEAYRWAHPMGYQRADTGEHVRASTATDPTPAVVAAQGRVRSHVSEADRLLRKAVAAMRGADAALARAFMAVELGNAGHMPADDSAFPCQETEGEIRKAKRAQKRRESRGEGWGEG